MKSNKKIPDDLDYLSELGFEKMKLSEKDVEDVQKRIDDRVRKPFSGSSVVSVTVIIGVLAVITWLFLGKKQEVQVETEKKKDLIAEEKASEKRIIPAATDTVFPILQVKNDHPVYPGEHFTQENTDLHFEPELNAEVLPSRQITSIEPNNAPAKTMLAMLPNAPVIYIYDLKVTDFQTLYFKKNDPFTIRNGGISAEYENIHGYRSHKGQTEPVYTADQVLKDGLAAFSKASYSKALSSFAVLTDLNKNDVNALFYSALSNYHLGKAQMSISLLDRVLEKENNVFHQEAEWYKALALLKLDKKEEAKELLLKINVQQGFYADRAGEKLKELN